MLSISVTFEYFSLRVRDTTILNGLCNESSEELNEKRDARTTRTHCFDITSKRIGGIAASCTFITQKCTGIVFAFVRGERTLSVPVFECVVSVSYRFVSVSCRFVSVSCRSRVGLVVA